MLLRTGSKDMAMFAFAFWTRSSHRVPHSSFWYLEKEVLLMKNGVEAEAGVFMCVVARSKKL